MFEKALKELLYLDKGGWGGGGAGGGYGWSGLSRGPAGRYLGYGSNLAIEELQQDCRTTEPGSGRELGTKRCGDQGEP